jgi:hypothetical protein
MERIGLFTPAQERIIIDAVKTFIKPKNKFLGWIQLQGVKYLIKGEWKTDIIPVIDTIYEKRYETARQLITDLLNKKINIKNISEETELRLFDSITRFIAAILDYFITTKIKEN